MKHITALGELVLVVILFTFTAIPTFAQGPPSGEVVYRVNAVDARSWIVTATNLETGRQVKFRLNPRAFERKNFHADLGGRGVGETFGVTAPRNEPLDNCCEVTDVPGERGVGATTRPEGDSRRSPTASHSARPSAPPGRPSMGGEGGWEIVSVEPTGWVVTARESSSGATMRFRVDPMAFVGYEFRADLRDLRRGQGFALIGLNAGPLGNCCTLLE